MNTSQPNSFSTELADPRRVWKPMLWIFLAAFAARLGVFLVGWSFADESGFNPGFYWTDSNQFIMPAKSMVSNGSYTEPDGSGHEIPYIMRPPTYPIFIAACYKIGGERVPSVILPQLVLAALACSFTYWIGAMLFTHRIGLMAGLLMAFDQMWLSYSNKIMSEAISVFFFTGSLVLLLQFLAGRKQVFLWCSAIALGLCTLANATTLYYWVVPAVALLVCSGFDGKAKVRWAVTFALVYFVVIGTWQARNFAYYGVYQIAPKYFSTHTAAALTLCAEQPQRDCEDIKTELYTHINNVFLQRYGLSKFDWADSGFRHRYYDSYLDTQNEQISAVLRGHIRTYARLVCHSLSKITVLALPYAELCRFRSGEAVGASKHSWRSEMAKSFEELMQGRTEKLRQTLSDVPLCKVFGFAWNVIYWAVTIPFALLGAYWILRRWSRLHTILVLGTIAYFVVTNSLAMPGGDMARYRLRWLPVLYSVAAVGWYGRKLSSHGSTVNTRNSAA